MEARTKWPPRHPPKKPKILLEEGRFCSIFRGVVGPCFCWGFSKKRVVGRGFFVVKLWWIAGESWEVDGQDSGSKNMPLVPDLSLRDSHFGNLVQPHPFCLGDRLGEAHRRRPVPPPPIPRRRGRRQQEGTPKIGKASGITSLTRPASSWPSASSARSSASTPSRSLFKNSLQVIHS